MKIRLVLYQGGLPERKKFHLLVFRPDADKESMMVLVKLYNFMGCYG